MKIRTEMSIDPFMQVCIYQDENAPDHNCEGRIEFEHAFLWAGKQINEAWAIIPACTYHHRGAGLNKEYNQYRAIIRADINDLEKRMPKRDWRQIYNYLVSKYGKKDM